MYVKIEMDYRTLKYNSWSGALDTLKDIEETHSAEVSKTLLNALKESREIISDLKSL